MFSQNENTSCVDFLKDKSTAVQYPAGSGKVLLAVRIVFLDRVQNLQIHAMRANQYVCIFSQFSEFNSEYAFHSICVFSVDFQKHASEYEVVCF